jgi:O-antigen/teichoic acid export membrane protein
VENSKIAKDIIVSCLSAVFTFAINFIQIPVYIRIIGLDGYAVVAFIYTFQAWFAVLDLGMSASVGREINKFLGRKTSKKEIEELLFTCFRIVKIINLAVGVFLFIYISSFAESKNKNSLVNSLSNFSIIFSCIGLTGFRWAINWYKTILISFSRHFENAIILNTSAVARLLGSVIIVQISGWGLKSVVYIHLVVTIFELLVMRWFVQQRFAFCGLDLKSKVFNLHTLRAISQFSGGFAAFTVLAVAASNFDKIVLAQKLSPDDYSRYLIVTTLAGVSFMFSAPISTVLMPRLVQEISNESKVNLVRLLTLHSKYLSVFLLPPMITLAWHSEAVVYCWLGDKGLGAEVSKNVKIWVCAAIFDGLSHIPYSLHMARGSLKWIVGGYFVTFLSVVLSVIYIVPLYGMLYFGITWLVTKVIYTLILHVSSIGDGVTSVFLWSEIKRNVTTIAAILVVAFCLTKVDFNLFGDSRFGLGLKVTSTILGAFFAAIVVNGIQIKRVAEMFKRGNSKS